MKNIFSVFILTFLFFSCGTVKNPIKESIKKLSEDDFNKIESYFDFSKEETLVIGVIQAREKCHYNNYRDIEKSSKWLLAMMDNTKLENSKSVLIILYKHKNIDNTVNNIRVFKDANSYFQNTMFSSGNSCHGIVVLNKQGYYIAKDGEYEESTIHALAAKLTDTIRNTP